jgi:hypothetical protein
MVVPGFCKSAILDDIKAMIWANGANGDAHVMPRSHDAWVFPGL